MEDHTPLWRSADLGGLEKQTRIIEGLLGSKGHEFNFSVSRIEDEDYRGAESYSI